MSSTELWVLVGSSIGIVGIIVTLVWRLMRDNEEKRNGTYTQINNVKKNIEMDFVRKELCDEKTGRILDDLKEIKADVKSLLKMNRYSDEQKK